MMLFGYIQSHEGIASSLLCHVKRHQDSAQSGKKLLLPARLNIQADELAGNYQTMTSHKNTLAPLITEAGCLLDIAGQRTISSHIKKSALQDYLSEVQLRNIAPLIGKHIIRQSPT
jgi:hypothetical protein